MDAISPALVDLPVGLGGPEFEPVLSADEILAAARLCLEVYKDAPRCEGWSPLDLAAVEAPEGYAPDGRFVNLNAVAWAKETVIEGDRAVGITFKGTDARSPHDWLDNVARMNRHYELLRPLLQAVDRYIERHGILRVIAAGHSLGGAMAAIYLDEHVCGDAARPGVRYDGVTFGSPGAILPASHVDARLLAVRHAQDIVPRAANLRARAGYRTPGRIIEIDEGGTGRFAGFGSGIRAHTMTAYLETLEAMYAEGSLARALSLHGDLAIYREAIPELGGVIGAEILPRPVSARTPGAEPAFEATATETSEERSARFAKLLSRWWRPGRRRFGIGAEETAETVASPAAARSAEEQGSRSISMSPASRSRTWDTWRLLRFPPGSRSTPRAAARHGGAGSGRPRSGRR